MSFKKNIKEKSDKIQRFVKWNFAYTIVAIVAIIVIISSGFFNSKHEKEIVAKSDTKVAEEQQCRKFESLKIYTSDYVVLFGSIAFCTAMIIRRNFKSKEEI